MRFGKVTDNPLKRRLRLAVLLISGKELGLDSLKVHLGCSRRTLFRDLKALRDDAEIETSYDRKGKVVRCASRPVLDADALSVAEITAMVLASHASPLRRATSLNDVIATATRRMRASLTPDQNELLGRQLHSICTPQSESSEGDHRCLALLLTSIGTGGSLRIVYEENRGVQEEILVVPKFIVFDSDQWWLLAYSEFHHDSIISFPLQGLLSVTVGNEPISANAATSGQMLRIDSSHSCLPSRPMTLYEFRRLISEPVRNPTTHASKAKLHAGASGT